MTAEGSRVFEYRRQVLADKEQITDNATWPGMKSTIYFLSVVAVILAIGLLKQHELISETMASTSIGATIPLFQAELLILARRELEFKIPEKEYQQLMQAQSQKAFAKTAELIEEIRLQVGKKLKEGSAEQAKLTP